MFLSWKTVVLGTVSHRALTLSMAGGINPRAAFWHRKFAHPEDATNAA